MVSKPGLTIRKSEDARRIAMVLQRGLTQEVPFVVFGAVGQGEDLSTGWIGTKSERAGVPLPQSI